MQRVKAVRAADEVRWGLGRAADAREFEHALRLHAHLIHSVDHALGDRVVSAAGTKRSLAAAVLDNL